MDRLTHEHGRSRALEEACSYLPQRNSRMEYRIEWKLNRDGYVALLDRGWRRFGTLLFRPTCHGCDQCRALRIDVQRFTATKSQRRAARRNSDVSTTLSEPTITSEHLRLYDEYHRYMHRRRGWPWKEPIEEVDYYSSFVLGNFDFAREIRYYHNARLIGVGLVDVTTEVTSSVYFFHAPNWRPRGPGTYSILQEIEVARQVGARYHYLGYWIRECPSMSYKSNFGPHQLLNEFVSDEHDPTWHDANS